LALLLDWGVTPVPLARSERMHVRSTIGRRARGRLLGAVVGIGITVVVLVAACGTRGSVAGASAGRRSTANCVPYAVKDIPAGVHCMVMPWQVAEAGPDARSVYISLATGCFSGVPTEQVVQTRTTIRIQPFGWRPAIRHGRLDLTCASSAMVRLHAPIGGRQITGESWPTPLRFGSLAHEVVVRPLGLPRLLGLPPRQALRVLWLFGFHAHLTGKGPEIVTQIPGWGLVGTDRTRPEPYTGVTKLIAGSRIKIPTRPRIAAGTPTGGLTGAIRFEGGAALIHRPPIAGTVALFNATGRLIARFHVSAGKLFRLQVTPGRYLLLADSEGWIFCGPTRTQVRTHHTTLITVGTGCAEA
jgi:hypothetical protein